MDPVTPNVTETFGTLEEAEAFVDGINYVNESSITVLGIDELDADTFVVNILDEDR